MAAGIGFVCFFNDTVAYEVDIFLTSSPRMIGQCDLSSIDKVYFFSKPVQKWYTSVYKQE